MWSIHALQLGRVWWTVVPSTLSAGQRAAVGLALLYFVLLEVVLLTLLNLGVEAVAGGIKSNRLLDAGKGLSFAALVGLLVASTLKFQATGVHLKRSDLWFAYANFRQLLEEAQAGEAATLLALPVGILVLAALLAWGLGRARRKGPALGPRPLAILTLLAAAGLAYTLATSPPARLFLGLWTPEGWWLGRVAPAPVGGGAVPPADRADLLGSPIEPYAPGGDFKRLDVVLVMLESVPWRRTPLGGGPAGVAPHLERLAAESVVFSRAYATSTHSDYAQMSILSSLHPRKYRQHDYYVGIEYPRTLIWDVLHPAGYRTSLFSSQNEQWGNMLSYLNTPGLDVLRHSPNWPRARHRGRGAESKVYEETPVEEWMRWRRRRGGEPYFTYLNFQADHFPYEAPPEAPRPFAPFKLDFTASFFRYPPERAPLMLNRFYNALAYSDAQLGRVVDFLHERGSWERTVVIVVSDHGEAFYEHAQPTHGSALYEEQVRSLLLMRLPGVAPRVVEAPVSLLDVMPTLLRYLGLPPHGNFQGRGDVLEPGYSAAGRPLFFTIQGITAEDGVLLDDRKYVVNWDRQERHLFDLAQDPEERDDLLAAEGGQPAAVEETAGELDRTLIDFLNRQTAYYHERLWRTGHYAAKLP